MAVTDIISNVLGAGGLVVDALAAKGQYDLGTRANEISTENLALQSETLDYNKALQKQIFQREDTSVQRRVEDLKTAGLSPVLAAGQGARAGQAVNVTAPQRGTQGLQMQAEALKNFAGRMLDTQQTMAEIALTLSQRRTTDATTAYTKEKTVLTTAQINKIITETDLLNRTKEFKIQESEYKSEIANFQAARDAHELSLINHFMANIKSHLIKGNYLPKEYNPLWIEFATNKIIYELAKVDKDFLNNLGGKASTNAIMKVLIPILRSVLKK